MQGNEIAISSMGLGKPRFAPAYFGGGFVKRLDTIVHADKALVTSVKYFYMSFVSGLELIRAL